MLNSLYEQLTHQQWQPACLYIVATPIGNMGDITLRALYILQHADYIAAEDTRHTGTLLKRYGIEKKLISVHEHNEHEASTKIITLLQENNKIVYVSDAGTPAISDPGTHLVDCVRNAGLSVVPIPGVSAVTCALSVAGFKPGAWHFEGFLPSKSKARMQKLQTLLTWESHLVFYEAPHRILELAKDLAIFDTRRVCIARELTKQFEQIKILPANQLSDWLTSSPQHQKGEFVVIIAAPTLQESEDISTNAQQLLKTLLTELPIKQAAKLTAQFTGENKNALYTLALSYKNEAP